MYAIRPTNKFRQDLKLCQKRGYNMQAITDVIKKLAAGETLPPQNRDHELSGNYKGFRECHIQPDWLLIYRINNNDLILFLSRTGTHSDLF
ncbi:type II toxin-antitoxin system YafQ family toxin [bacterium]|jgi:mRNA interferase YafQ|nr:type II toxin-antitoxin system YafQ family toxin [bacterium]